MNAQAVPDFILRPDQTFSLAIVSLTGNHWEGTVREVSIPGATGRFGVMSGHTPLLSILREGMITIYPAAGAAEAPIHLYVSGGLAEVQPAQVTILADLALRSEHLDNARAEAARLAATAPMAAAFTDKAYAETHSELMRHFGENVRIVSR